MATLNIRSDFNITVNGLTIEGKHGSTTDDADDYFAVTVDGNESHKAHTLADDTVATLWDEDSELPANFDFMFLWTDVACYLQLIGSAGHVVIQLRAKVPFVLGSDDILPAANTTILVGGAAPTFENIDSIVLSNNTGGAANYVFFVVD